MYLPTSIIIILIQLAKLSIVPVDHRIKLKETEKKEKYLDFARALKSLWNTKVTIVPIVIGAFGTEIKGLLNGLEDLDVGGPSGDHPNYTIVENGQNTEKSPRDSSIPFHMTLNIVLTEPRISIYAMV